MNITRNLLHEWYHGGARTPADVQRLAQENLGLTLTAEKVKKILEDQIPLEQWYQTRIMAAIRQLYPEAFVRKIAAGVYSERGFPDVLVIIDGLYIGLEIKRPFLGKPTPLQLDTIEAIKRAGGTARVVCLPEEAVGPSNMLQQVFDILWEAAQDAAQRISDFFRRIGEWAKEVSQKVLRAYAGNMAILYGLATEKQIRLMYHRRPRIRKKWYHIILRRIRRFLKTEAAA